MSLERVIKALIDLGLSRSDAEVYVYLAKKGPNKVVALARALNYNRKKIHASLKTLQTKGLVTKDRTIFSALPFEEALDLLIKMEKEQAQELHESKKELLASWKKDT
jgi:sugar-specific transcriptional regulator TrmB